MTWLDDPLPPIGHPLRDAVGIFHDLARPEVEPYVPAVEQDARWDEAAHGLGHAGSPYVERGGVALHAHRRDLADDVRAVLSVTRPDAAAEASQGGLHDVPWCSTSAISMI